MRIQADDTGISYGIGKGLRKGSKEWTRLEQSDQPVEFRRELVETSRMLTRLPDSEKSFRTGPECRRTASVMLLSTWSNECTVFLFSSSRTNRRGLVPFRITMISFGLISCPAGGGSIAPPPLVKPGCTGDAAGAPLECSVVGIRTLAGGARGRLELRAALRSEPGSAGRCGRRWATAELPVDTVDGRCLPRAVELDGSDRLVREPQMG